MTDKWRPDLCLFSCQLYLNMWRLEFFFYDASFFSLAFYPPFAFILASWATVVWSCQSAPCCFLPEFIKIFTQILRLTRGVEPIRSLRPNAASSSLVSQIKLPGTSKRPLTKVMLQLYSDSLVFQALIDSRAETVLMGFQFAKRLQFSLVELMQRLSTSALDRKKMFPGGDFRENRSVSSIKAQLLS